MEENVLTETVTKEIVTEASAPVAEPPSLQEQTEAQVQIIEAEADASAKRIRAEAAADVARIEARKEDEEWRTQTENRLAMLETSLTSIQQQLEKIATPTVAVLAGTPPSMPLAETEDPSSLPPEPSEPAEVRAAVVEVTPPPPPAPAPALRRRRERYL